MPKYNQIFQKSCFKRSLLFLHLCKIKQQETCHTSLNSASKFVDFWVREAWGSGSGADPCHKKNIVSKSFLSHLQHFLRLFWGEIGGSDPDWSTIGS